MIDPPSAQAVRSAPSATSPAGAAAEMPSVTTTAPPPRTRDAAATRARLIDAARAVTSEVGVSAASARVIASRAAVNQALIFYHFGTVAELIEAASNQAVDEAVDHYREVAARAATIGDLVDLARSLHDRENEVGTIAFMAQVLAAADNHPAIGRAAHYAMSLWSTHIREALDRMLAGTVLDGLVDRGGLAHLITATLIGMELYGAADGADDARAALAAIGTLVDTLAAAGPVTRTLVTAATRKL